MLQDRPYMREGYDRQRTSVLTWLVAAIIAAYVLENVFRRWFGMGDVFERAFGLSAAGLKAGHVWTLVTYGFLHSTGNMLQILAYVITLYFIGGEILSILGTRRFIGFYASTLVAGAGAWLAVHWRSSAQPQGELMMGASAAVSGLFILYACFFPNREITQLLFFVLPIRVKPKYIAYILVGLDLCGFVFYELLGAASPIDLAPSAHLGGMAAAWIYFRYVHDSSWSFALTRSDIELPRWMKHAGASKAQAAIPTFSVNLGSKGHLRAEVDRILDKINSDGFGSLSVEEKKVLDEARDLIGRR